MESPQFFISVLPTFLIRGAFAILCGALVGIERERKGKPAGFRTNTLICLGATLYMLVSEFLLERLGVSNVDHTRIAAQVVTGIGFLGAGTIIQSRGTITGLTSAATIWVVAGIGLLIGAGFPLLGLFCTILVLFALIGLGKIEPKLLGKCQFVTCDVVFSEDGGRTQGELATILSENDMDISEFDITKIDENTSKLRLRYCERHPFHRRYIADIVHTEGVIEVRREQ